MNRSLTILALLLALSPMTRADVWKWVDARGNTHFVDTMRPIYTWVDEFDKVHYSDTPDHEDAISVELVWHSEGSLDELQEPGDEKGSGGYAYPGETAEQRAQREQAKAYYCKRATEIYESYVNAPQLYRTGANGDREYLSKEEVARTIAETRAKKDEFCG
jgi:hypothetical protein